MEPQDSQVNVRKSNKNVRVVLWVLSILLTAAATALICFIILGKDEPKNNEAVKTETNQSEVVKKPEVAMKEYCAEHEKMCFEYPEGWKVNQKTFDYDIGDSKTVKLDSVSLSLPNKDINLSLKSGISGIGGVCFPEDTGKVYIINQVDTRLDGYRPTDQTGAKAYAISLITSNKEETEFTPRVGLTTNLSIINKTAQSACDVGYFGMVDGRTIQLSADDNYYSHGLVQFVSGTGLASSEEENASRAKSYSSLEEAKKALASDEYVQALDIVASAHYK